MKPEIKAGFISSARTSNYYRKTKIIVETGYLAGYRISRRIPDTWPDTGYLVSVQIICRTSGGRISGQIRIRYNPTIYLSIYLSIYLFNVLLSPDLDVCLQYARPGFDQPDVEYGVPQPVKEGQVPAVLVPPQVDVTVDSQPGTGYLGDKNRN